MNSNCNNSNNSQSSYDKNDSLSVKAVMTMRLSYEAQPLCVDCVGLSPNL